ncbi:hypothetical protein LCGC14_2385050 [marine sediment metagenome]|uniref:Uncharacterized protein n=1 Tax=marine sediment metagenome TaxID=412755 RepID=A0A0F9BZX7_9ZZZZ
MNLPSTDKLKPIRCMNIKTDGFACRQLLGYIDGSASLKCPRCGEVTAISNNFTFVLVK